LALDIGAEILALEKAQFIVRREVLGLETRSALQSDDFHARLAELGREDAARRADPDNDDIGLFDRHGSCPPLQPDDRLAGEGLRALQILRRE